MPRELSYYRLSLMQFLSGSHPDKSGDEKFITARADAAAEAYESAVKRGMSHIEAEETASVILYKGLHFSAFDTLRNILQDEFSGEIFDPENVAKIIYPRLKSVINNYRINDDFADSSEYEKLYTEIVGSVQIMIEDGDL